MTQVVQEIKTLTRADDTKHSFIYSAITATMNYGELSGPSQTDAPIPKKSLHSNRRQLSPVT